MAEIEESLFNNRWKIIGIGGLILILLVVFALLISYIAYHRKKSYIKLPEQDDIIQKQAAELIKEKEINRILQLRADKKRAEDAKIEADCINKGKAYDYNALICRDASPETCTESTIKQYYDPIKKECIPDPQSEVEEITVLTDD